MFIYFTRVYSLDSEDILSLIIFQKLVTVERKHSRTSPCPLTHTFIHKIRQSNDRILLSKSYWLYDPLRITVMLKEYVCVCVCVSCKADYIISLMLQMKKLKDTERSQSLSKVIRIELRLPGTRVCVHNSLEKQKPRIFSITFRYSSWRWGWDPEICMPNRFPRDANAVGTKTMLW